MIRYAPQGCKVISFCNMFYKNTFQYTDLLQKRFILRPVQQLVNQQGTIIEFIKNLSQNEYQFNYIMYWLANFYQNLTSSKMPLVLIGDEEFDRR